MSILDKAGTYKFPLLLNSIPLIGFCLLSYFANHGVSGYLGVILGSGFMLLLLFIALLNILMLIFTLNSEDNRPNLVLFYTAAAVSPFLFRLITHELGISCKRNSSRGWKTY